LFRSRSFISTAVPWVLFAVVTVAGTMFDAFTLSVATVTMIWILLAAGLNISMGYGGVVNFGIGAFYGIGAYAAAILAVNHHIPFLICLVVGPALATLAGLILGPVILSRTKGMQFGIVTLAIGIAADDIFNNLPTSFDGGPNGISGISFPGWLQGAKAQYYFIALFAAAGVAVCQYIGRHHFGEVLRALRDDVYLAKSLGYRPLRHRSAAFVLSAGIAGLAGVLYAYYISYVSPEPFALSGASFQAFAIVAFGGMGATWGPVIAAFLLTGAIEYVNIAPTQKLIFYGIAILVVVLIVPDGLGPGVVRIVRKARSRQRLTPAQASLSDPSTNLSDASTK
jgi:branched-chain amino acid transport system permease protein